MTYRVRGARAAVTAASALVLVSGCTDHTSNTAPPPSVATTPPASSTDGSASPSADATSPADVVRFNNAEGDQVEVSWNRFFTRVFGAPKNHALATFALIGINVRKNRDWHVRRLLADPWLTAIGDTTDPNWQELHGHRKRKPRVKALHERIAHNEIPGHKPDSLMTRRHRNSRTTADVATDGAPPG